MRILLVCPQLPPSPGGVSDHSRIMATELRKQGHAVLVITFSQNADPIKNVETQITSGISLFRKDIRQRLRAFRPDQIVVQYTPQLYAPRFYGIAPKLPIALLALRCYLRAPISLLVHESNYPVNFSPRGILIGIPHVIQFFLMALASRNIFFSHAKNKEIWARSLALTFAKVSVLPVYSNIEITEATSDLRSRFGIPAEAKILLYFGGAHDTNLIPMALSTHANISAKFAGKNVFLVFCGISERDLKNKYHVESSPQIIATGFLPAEEISAFYREANVVLAPFAEGITTRRSSAMAALQHGKALVTTCGWCTESDHAWKDFTAIVRSRDASAYSKLTENLLFSPAESEALGKRASLYYKKHFSSEVIVKKFTSELQL